MITKFELTERQQKEIQEWQDAINKIYGEYGSYDFIFSPNEIGTSLTVYSHTAEIGKDFTDIDSW